MNNLDWYLQQSESLTLAEMDALQLQIFTQADSTDPEFQEVWQDLLSSAIKYASIRAGWQLLSRSERSAQDQARTATHNDVITNFLILERLFKLKGWRSQAWTEQLFLQADQPQRHLADVTDHRKRIGDFANYLAFISALSQR